ncbi:hypothetical protein LZ30DRAFT_737462 [Colletotrichum cereale]|nr:hypothetical protein LZ30DRAFT_737462 [Colletotrichum cereale]
MSCNASCEVHRFKVEPNPDVDGIGVLIGFFGTAWLVVILVIIRYMLAFNPYEDPLQNAKRDGTGRRAKDWKPNMIDVKFVSMFSKLRKRFAKHKNWDIVTTKILRSLCDIQILTGLGILLSGYIGLKCYTLTYHWKLITYLAWSSNLTHTACLSGLRGYMYQHQAERNLRMGFMAILVAGLVTAIVPTAYFGIGSDLYSESVARPWSNARCFFHETTAKQAWIYEQNITTQIDEQFGKFKETPEYESHIISIVLLTLSFTTRTIKMFRLSSDLAKITFREQVGNWAGRKINTMVLRYQSFSIGTTKKKLIDTLQPLDILIGLYLTVKLFLDLFVSELSDLYWLVVSSIWVTMRISIARNIEAQDEWGFGQVLPVFLLLGPVATIVLTIRNGDQVEESGIKIETEIDDLVRLYQNETKIVRGNDTEGLGQWLLEVVTRCSDKAEALRHLTAIVQVNADRTHASLLSTSNNRSIRQNAFETIPLDAYERLETDNESHQGRVSHDEPLFSVEAEADEIPPTNQDTFLQGIHCDGRTSLSQYSMKSRWMNMVICLACAQILALTIVTFYYSAAGPYFSFSTSILFIRFYATVIPSQALNVFTALVLGNYMNVWKLSRYQLLFRAFTFISLLVWVLFILFFPIGLLGFCLVPIPLGLILCQKLYLSYGHLIVGLGYADYLLKLSRRR